MMNGCGDSTAETATKFMDAAVSPSTSAECTEKEEVPQLKAKCAETPTRRPRAHVYNFGIGLLVTVVVLKVSVLTLAPLFYGRDVEIKGHASREFAGVKEAFRRNFLNGYERDGAAFAVYHRGQLVADLYAGDANTEARKPWTAETRTLLFSVTKAVSSLCIALLVDRGHLRWDDLVAQHWPEFGVNGKNATTVQHVLSHQAGLPYIKEPIYYDDAADIESALNKIANATPLWHPGKESGYHPLTFGWLVDGIVKHADPKGRHLHQFFKEEIADKYGLDISIGVDGEADFLRSAFITNPSAFDFLRDSILDMRIFFMVAGYYAQPSNSIIASCMRNPKWLSLSMDSVPFNTYSIQRLRLGAVNGLSGARDLARLFALLVNGTLVSERTFEAMRRPTLNTWHIERTVLYPLMKGHGFFYERHPTRSGAFVFGHPGYGCNALYVDPHDELVIAYLSNGLKSATSVLCRPYQNLLRSVYEEVSSAQSQQR